MIRTACVTGLALAAAMAAATPAAAQSSVRFGVSVGNAYSPSYGAPYGFGSRYRSAACAYDPYCAPYYYGRRGAIAPSPYGYYGYPPVSRTYTYETRDYYDPMPRWRQVAGDRYGSRDYRGYDDYRRDRRYDRRDDYRGYDDYSRAEYGGYDSYGSQVQYGSDTVYRAGVNLPPETRDGLVRYDLVASGAAAPEPEGVRIYRAGQVDTREPVRYDIYRSGGAASVYDVPPSSAPEDLLLGGPN